jgi:ssDNA-binding Zn-finger/Zn-ribbon topoisomerase 1
VKELEAKGIGRPSTYATIMGTILTRAYVAEETTKQRTVLIPTELGFKVIDALTGRFAFAELDYTRNVEADLDLIAEGKAVYKTVIAGVDNLLALELGKMQSAAVGESHPCECGGQMRRKPGPKGFFWGCSKYPECTKTLPDDNGQPGARTATAPVDTAHPCTCGNGYMQPRSGKFGAFWSCSAKPACDITLPDDNGKPGVRKPAPAAATGSAHKCPKCGKPMRLKNGFKGPFWGCSAFPDCKATANDKDGVPVFKAVASA